MGAWPCGLKRSDYCYDGVAESIPFPLVAFAADNVSDCIASPECSGIVSDPMDSLETAAESLGRQPSGASSSAP